MNGTSGVNLNTSNVTVNPPKLPTVVAAAPFKYI